MIRLIEEFVKPEGAKKCKQHHESTNKNPRIHYEIWFKVVEVDYNE